MKLLKKRIAFLIIIGYNDRKEFFGDNGATI